LTARYNVGCAINISTVVSFSNSMITVRTYSQLVLRF
jgi:hypothetical protein